MENTFNKEDQSENVSIILENHGDSNMGDDLVFIDEDWMDVYPVQPVNFKPKLKESTGKLVKEEAKEQKNVELYEFPKRIQKEIKMMSENRRKKKGKYQLEKSK